MSCSMFAVETKTEAGLSQVLLVFVIAFDDCPFVDLMSVNKFFGVMVRINTSIHTELMGRVEIVRG